ncbi:CHASE domain-containing protein [Vulcanococcus limneticus]|uniref:CHASE domain-containing protein n=1 Tax=Vulcanococcus limneticus TaxID=2170428 RepID=UPI00398BCAE0
MGRTRLRLPVLGNRATTVLLALAYALVGSLTLWLVREAGYGLAVPVWPASGLALALLLRRGRALAPGVLVGSLLVNLVNLPLLSDAPAPRLATVAVPLVIALGATLQAVLGAAWVRRRLGSRPALDRAQDILRLVLLGGPCACLAGSVFGVGAQLLAGVVTLAQAPVAWLTWWVGDSVGVIVFAPLVLMLLPDRGALWRGRRWRVALPSLLVTALSVAVFLFSAAQERRQLQLYLAQQATQASSALQRNLVRHQEVLEGLRSLMAVHTLTVAGDFERYTRSSLQRLDGLEALSWNVFLRPEQLEPFEQQRRRETPGYRIFERGPDGTPQPVEPGRSGYVAVDYIEPLARNARALGFDIASDPVRAHAIDRARDSGRIQATAPIRLVQESGSQQGILLLLPVYRNGGQGQDPEQRRRDLKGFAVGVYRFGNLLNDTFAGGDYDQLSLRLLDVTPGEGAVELARRGRPDLLSAALPRTPVVSQRFEQAGRLWKLEVRPAAGSLQGRNLSTAPALLVGGLLVCGLLEALLLLATGVESRVRIELERKLRTSLAAAAVAHEIKQPLTALLYQADWLEAELRRIEGAPAAVQGLPSGPDQAGVLLPLIEAAEGVSCQARQVSITVEKIRDVLRNVASQLAPIDLTDPIFGALLLAKADLNRYRIRLETVGLEEPVTVLGDREQLQLVVHNLIRNAIEASGAGGGVRLALHRGDQAVELEVADDGPGFPQGPVDLDGLLMASSKSEGLGIGLYVVRCAVENHHGSLEIGRSDLGGASVRLRFPLASKL